jgi:site-specific recombinase XerC
VELSTAAEIADAFARVDDLLEQARAAAPAVALLLSRARQQGISEHQLAANLRATTPVLRWLLKLAPDATANRIDLGEDVGALIIRWAQKR